MPALQMPVRVVRPGDTDPSVGELRNASPARTARAARMKKETTTAGLFLPLAVVALGVGVVKAEV